MKKLNLVLLRNVLLCMGVSAFQLAAQNQVSENPFRPNILISGFYMGEAYLSLTGSFDEETFKGEVKNDTESFPIDATKMAVLSAGKSQKPEATITIGLNPVTKPYDPMIFGGFLEHFGKQIYGGIFEPGSPLSNEQGFRTDVLDALKELQIPIVRWPGGCFVSGYHWEDGVGKNRMPVDDMAWGVIEPNTFGTDEFINLSRLMGWEPFICNNAGNGTIEEMKNWVEYTNGTDGKYAQMRKENGYSDPRGVKIWSIGNENWSSVEIGQKTIEEWVPLVVEAAKEMKKVDPSVQLSAAAMPNREWTLPLLEKAGSFLDYISIHKYWLGYWQNNEVADYMTCVMESQGPEELISRYIIILEEAGYRGKIKIAFDEWNLKGWHHPNFPRKTVQNYEDPDVIESVKARDKNLIASQYAMGEALFSASFFNACLRHAEDVGMANIAPLVNTRGPLRVHPDGIVKRTHFHTMSMYANLLDSRVVDAKVESTLLQHEGTSIPVVDVVVTQSDDKKTWSIAIINRHPSMEGSCTIKIQEELLEGTFKATVLAGDSPEAYNDIQNPERVVPQNVEMKFENGVALLPAHSLTILKVTEI